MPQATPPENQAFFWKDREIHIAGASDIPIGKVIDSRMGRFGVEITLRIQASTIRVTVPDQEEETPPEVINVAEAAKALMEEDLQILSQVRDHPEYFEVPTKGYLGIKYLAPAGEALGMPPYILRVTTRLRRMGLIRVGLKDTVGCPKTHLMPTRLAEAVLGNKSHNSETLPLAGGGDNIESGYGPRSSDSLDKASAVPSGRAPKKVRGNNSQ